MFLVVLAPLLVAADKGDWSTDWSSWSHVDLNNNKTNHNLNHNHRENGDRFKKLRDKGSKERLSEEEIVWDVRKAEVGCVLLTLPFFSCSSFICSTSSPCSCYSSSSKVGVRYRVVRDEEGTRLVLLKGEGVDRGLKVKTRYRKKVRQSPK